MPLFHCGKWWLRADGSCRRFGVHPKGIGARRLLKWVAHLSLVLPRLEAVAAGDFLRRFYVRPEGLNERGAAGVSCRCLCRLRTPLAPFLRQVAAEGFRRRFDARPKGLSARDAAG